MDLNTIRAAEKDAHETMYSQSKLYEPGSWLSRPVKSLVELFPLLEGRQNFRALDLACGVGRNSIAIAKTFPGGLIDCVDILPMAVDKLRENAHNWGVENAIRGIVSPIDRFWIERNRYDLIVAVAALEHMDSEENMLCKLVEIREGLRPGGIFCMVMNTDIRERDVTTGMYQEPQFEINMAREEMRTHLHGIFKGDRIVKDRILFMSYETPREKGPAILESQVLTFAVQKEERP